MGILLVVSVAWRYMTLSAWGWFQDDWIYMTRTSEMSFWAYVTQNYNGHLMPGQFAIAWGLAKVAPLNFTLALTVEIGFMAASLVVWALALRAIFGERPRMLYPLSLLALSPIFMPVSLWWAAAMQVYPLQLCMGLVVLFVARHSRTPHRRSDLLAASTSFFVGLLFWEKALLVLIPAVFVALILRPKEPFVRRVMSATRQLSPVIAIAAAYIPLYLLGTRAPDGAKTQLFQERTLSDTFSFFSTGVVDLGIPSLLGGPWSTPNNPQALFSSGNGVTTLLFIAVACLGIATAIKARREGWLPVAMAVIYTVAAWGLLFTSSRFSVVGVASIRDARYAADILPVALLAVAFLISPTVLEGRNQWLRVDLSPAVIERIRTAFAIATVAVSVSAIVMSGRLWDATANASPKTWTENLIGDVKAGGNVSVYNAMAPSNVILSAFFWGDGRISQMMKPLGLATRYDQPASEMYVPDWAGHLKQAVIEPAATSASPAPVAGCGYLLQPGAKVRVPLTKKLFAWQWGVQVDYFTQAGGSAVFTLGEKSVQVDLSPGLNHRQFVLETAVDHVVVTSRPETGAVCITNIQVGTIKAGDKWIGDLTP